MDTNRTGMTIALVTESVSRGAGGLFFSVRNLAQSLREQTGATVHVVGFQDEHTAADLPAWGPFPPTALKVRGPQSLAYAPALVSTLRDLAPDLAHTQGIWRYYSRATWKWASSARRPYLISPRGMLDPWAVRQSAWKKRLAWRAFERAHLEGAACIHALCEPEAVAIRQFGLRNPLCVLPNGVELPARSKQTTNGLASREKRSVLFLSRLHPKKGLSELIRGWALVQKESPDRARGWELIVAGTDRHGYRSEIETLARDLEIERSVRFVGPKFGAAKEEEYLAADAFVLPSHSEGLPQAVLEAWAHGLPVLMTPACNLPAGFAKEAALRVEADPRAIAGGLNQLFEMTDAERLTIGQHGRGLVESRYTWPTVADQMSQVYNWVLGGGPLPPSITLV
jgi:poly(glycerol-phosphate) alpha-glucosyltransferase